MNASGRRGGRRRGGAVEKLAVYQMYVIFGIVGWAWAAVVMLGLLVVRLQGNKPAASDASVPVEQATAAMTREPEAVAPTASMPVAQPAPSDTSTARDLDRKDA